jgi:MYXO-CTERM domain-containing protein
MQNRPAGFSLAARAIIAACSLAVLATASADVGPVFLRITATNTLGTGTLEIMTADVDYDATDDSWFWFGGAVDIEDGDGETIGRWTGGYLAIGQDPFVALGWAVQAGGIPTDFLIQTALLSFPTINSPTGSATSALTVSDSFGDDGATMTGLGPNGDIYYTAYNGYVPGGTQFFSSQPSLATGIHGNSNDTQQVDTNADGTADFIPLGGSAFDMSAQVNFRLTAGDSASGTNSYTILPEPASLIGLAGLALIGLGRRR